MNEFRCKKCSHLLAKEEILYGKVEIKCYACDELNEIDLEYRETGVFTADLVPV